MSTQFLLFLFGLFKVNVNAQCRDRFEYPFANTSIWNMPIGSKAIFMDSALFDGSPEHPLPSNFHGDDDIFLSVSTADKLYPWYNQGHWGQPHTYDAYCNVTGKLVAKIYFPSNWTNDNYGHNNAAGILQSDNVTLFQMQPLYHCNQSSPILAQQHCFKKQNVSILGDGIYGCHGGSGLSSVGGTIRINELIGNQNNLKTIKHALKLEFSADTYYYNNTGTNNPCYIWPAINCDGYHNQSNNTMAYGGSNKYFVPGSLLSVPSDITVTNISTVPAKKILYALQNYGGYIVDDTGKANRGTMCVEYGLQEEFQKYYGYSFEATNNEPFYQDLVRVFSALKLVINNSPTTIGGGGVPLQPLLPPICQ